MELRIGAFLSQDEFMIRVLSDRSTDWHATMALEMYKEVFKNADSALRKELRVIAKMLVFGLNYGRGVKSIARQLGCSKKADCNLCQKKLDCRLALREAQELVNRYFAPIPGYLAWRELQKKLARTVGYIETPFGNRRRFDMITDLNWNDVERQSLNSPIQSTANYVNLHVMLTLYHELGRLVRPHWPIHDAVLMSILLKASPKDVNDVISLMEEVPRRVLKTDLPFFVDFEVGMRWGSLSKWKGKIPEPTTEQEPHPIH
jgi:DNA polymerase-1